MKVLLCGARTWEYEGPVYDWLDRIPMGSQVVYPDEHSIGDIVEHYIWEKKRHTGKSFWLDYGSDTRHQVQKMFKEHAPFDLVLAFHPFLANSSFTCDVIANAVGRLVPVVLVEHDSPQPHASVGKWVRYEPAIPLTFMTEFLLDSQ